MKSAVNGKAKIVQKKFINKVEQPENTEKVDVKKLEEITIDSPKRKTNTREKDEKFIAFDSCLVIQMANFLNPNIEDDGIREALDNGTFRKIKEKYLEMSYEELPQLLKDNYLNETEEIVNEYGKREKVFFNLQDIRNLRNLILSGKIKPVVTPIVLAELYAEKHQYLQEFLTKYCKTITEDQKFLDRADDLAEKYAWFGAMDSTFSGKLRKVVPENDAYVMSEAALLGIHLITLNGKDFIKTKRSYTNDRINKICKTNKNFSCEFINSEWKKVNPRPYTPGTFLGEYFKGLPRPIVFNDTVLKGGGVNCYSLKDITFAERKPRKKEEGKKQ